MNTLCHFIEAKDQSGKTWEVLLIQAGLSGNGTYYPADILQKSTPLFEGVRALARADEEHTQDVNRSVKNIVGWFTDPRWDGSRVVAQFHVSEAADWLRVMLLDAWNQGKKDIVGFSIVAQGKASRNKNQLLVESIEKVFTVDVVLNPAAGGQILKLTESIIDPGREEEKRMLKKLLESLRKIRPDLYAKVNPDTATEDEVTALLSEALAATGQNNIGQELLAEAKRLADEAKKSREEAERVVKMAESKALVSKKLLDSGLPVQAQERVSQRLEGRICEAQEIDQVIKDERDYLALFSPSGKVVGNGQQIRVGIMEAEKIPNALDGFFANQDVNGIPRFRSFREAFELVTGHRSITNQAFTEAFRVYQGGQQFMPLRESLNTSSWAEILGDSITRRMLAEYNVPGLQDWRKIVSDITSTRDFRTLRRMRMGGYGLLADVAQGADYQPFASPGDEEESFSVSKKGNTEDITMEMLANDDVGAIRRIPMKMARAAAITLYRKVFDILKDNPAMGDALAVFHANHSNLGSTALSAAELLAIYIAMGGQAAYGASTEILGLVPKYLVIPRWLIDTANRLCKSATVVGATNNAGTEPNMHSDYGLEPLVVPYWTDQNDYCAICDPKDCPTIEVCFYNGQEEPELFAQDQPTVGSVFSADKITYKIRHIYGVKALDYRGMYKEVVG